MALLHPHQVKCGGARAEIPPPKLSTGLLLGVVLGNQLSRPLAVLKGGEAIRYG